MGAKISKAHDMLREFKVIHSLEKAAYSKTPKPILACEDPRIIGAPFFLMEKVEGEILRNKMPKGVDLSPTFFKQLSINTLDSFIELHQLELIESGLIQLGKPEGYVLRQVEGWISRYEKAKTEEIATLENAAVWLMNNLPKQSSAISFIHNDFKFDNLVLQSWENPQIDAVLDWEMATIGDPLMDLGTLLAYWAEDLDAEELKMFNLSHVNGNFTRQEVIQYYALKSGLDVSHMLFYYVFGIFKVAVIAQQIYQRFSQGFANDPRFGELIKVVRAFGTMAQRSIQSKKI
jgi:aminoglycoside phosphotransferase (APT) family kinase protein